MPAGITAGPIFYGLRSEAFILGNEVRFPVGSLRSRLARSWHQAHNLEQRGFKSRLRYEGQPRQGRKGRRSAAIIPR